MQLRMCPVDRKHGLCGCPLVIATSDCGSVVGSVWVVAIAVVVVNVPFGYWRSGVRKFSLAWFVAVHAPVPVVAGLRILSGLGWQLATFPILVGAYFAGQYLGGMVRQRFTPAAWR